MKVGAKTKILSSDIGLILFLSLLSITWFRGNFIINAGDFGFPFSRIQFFRNTLYFWDDSISLGYLAPGQLAFLVPYTIYAALTEHIGLSLLFFEKSLFYLWFALSGLAMYYLCSALEFKRLAKLAASLFYMMNPYVLQIPWHLASGMLMPAYLMSPLILGLFVRSLNSPKGLRYIFILAVIWFAIGTYGYVNPALAVVHWFIVFSYLLYYCLINNKERGLVRRAVRLTSILVILWLFLNLFWIIPYGSVVFEQRKAVSDPSLGFISSLETFKLNSAKLVGALRLGGLWSLHGEWIRGVPYYRWAKFYLTWPFILISFLIPFFSFLPLLKNSECRKSECMYLSILTVVGLFLVKGTQSPLGNVNIWLYRHIPLLGTAFKANIQKWGLMLTLAMAPLLGLGISCAVDFLSDRFGKTISSISTVCIFILLFVVLVFPFWTGDVIFAGEGIVPSARIKVPEYYSQFKEWTSQNENNERIFSLPLSKSSNTIYRWEDTGYAGGDIIRFFSTKPIIYANTGMGYEIPLLLSKQIEKRSGQVSAGRLFGLLNVKYILLHRDINWRLIRNHPWWFKHNPGNLDAFLNSQDGIKLDRNFGKLDLYKISDEFFLPHIYSSSASTLVAGDAGALVPMSYTRYLDRKPVLLFTEQMKEGTNHQLLGDGRKISNIVFCNSNWQDLVVDVSPKLALGEQELEVGVKEKGDYELWLDCLSVEIDEEALDKLEIKVDNKKVPLVVGSLRRGKAKWKRIGKIYLEKGKYRIEIQNSDENGKLALFLIKKERREKVQKEIQGIIDMPGVSVGYLFSRERSDLASKYFYIPDDSEYIIKAKLSPNFVRARIPESSGLNLELGSLEEFEKWSFKPSNVTYNYFIEPGILAVSAYFDGDSKEDEYVQMRREGLKIDLEEYSWFDLTYKVEDPKVQTIEVVLGIDFDRDGVVDVYIKGIYPRPAATRFDKFSYNVLGKVKRRFPDKGHYDLLELELYPHKLWRVDCKSFKRRGKYEFHIKNMEFCNYGEDLLEVCDYALDSDMGEEDELRKWRVSSNLQSYSCSIQDGDLVITDRFDGQVDENVTLSRSFENLNLEEFQFIELEYKVDDPLFQSLEVVLRLDFDKDGIADKDIFSSISLSKTFKKFRFNAFEVAKESCPGVKEYHLLQVRLRLKEGRKDFVGFARKGKYSWYFRDMKIYSTSFVSPDDFAFDRPVFEVDGEKCCFKGKFKNRREVEDVLFSREVYLKKGERSISNLLREGGNFEFDWVVIKPMSGDLSAQNEPKIVFKRVNPTKYEVKVSEASKPLWLVFSESFHKQWRLYHEQRLESRPSFGGYSEEPGEIVAEYPKLGVKEAKHTMRFAPEDIKYLFKKPLDAEHHVVNGYANGWYIEPDKLGLGENFKLTLYFWPQSLFYLGLGISGLTLTGCIVHLGKRWRRD